MYASTVNSLLLSQMQHANFYSFDARFAQEGIFKGCFAAKMKRNIMTFYCAEHGQDNIDDPKVSEAMSQGRDVQ